MKLSRILSPLCALLVLACVGIADAGVNSWTQHGPQDGGGVVWALAVHPANGSIALLSTERGIHRSTDGGDTWTLVKSDIRRDLTSIAFDPGNPNRVAGTDGLIYLSEDGGLTYATLQGPSINNGISLLAFAPDGTLYAAQSASRAWKSAPPFTSWTEVTGPWPVGTTRPSFITIDRVNPLIVYIGINGSGMYRSADGGTNWASINNGFPDPSLQSILNLSISPADPARLLAASIDGVWLSTNSGASWSHVDTSYANWVGFDPANANNAYAVNAYEVRRSSQGGLNWTSAAELRVPRVTMMDFIPGVSGGLMVASSNGLLRSHDGGTSFQYRNAGLTGTTPRKIVASDDGSVFVSIESGEHDLFERDGDSYRPVPTARGGQREILSFAVAPTDSNQIFTVNASFEFHRSFDRGAHWIGPHPAFMPLNNDFVGAVQFDPSNAQVAYVGRRGLGIWKTTDAGATFLQLNNSPPFVGVIGPSPHDSNVLYASGGDPYRSGIYKTADGGASWTEQLAPRNSFPEEFNSFSFHPTNPDVVYATTEAGVFRTTNGGSNWSLVDFGAPSGGTHVYGSAVLFDPVIPTTITMVAPGRYSGFLRSVDGGVTWEQTDHPIRNMVITGAVLDPHDSAVVIAITSSADITEYRVAPDLSLTASIPPLQDPMPVSSSVMATYTVRNNGPHPSSASELVINTPSWMTPTGIGCTRVAQTLTCRHGVLRVGESHSFQVSFVVGPVGPTGGSGQIRAVLNGHETDMSVADNTLTRAVTAAELADVDVSITGGTQVIDRRDSTDVTVTVHNSGPSPATAATIALQIPANMSSTNLTWSDGTCLASPGTVSCNVGSLAVGGSATVSFSLTGEAAGQGTLTAEVDSAGTDPDGENTASRTFTVRPLTDMRITLAESADPVTVDAGFQYIATVTNIGSDVDEFQVTIPVTGAVLLDATSTMGACTFAANTAHCTSPGLTPGNSGTITLTLNSMVPGIATATATLAVANRDPDTSNNSASIGTTLRLVGDVSVEITDSADPVNVGATFDYIITTRNGGPNAGAVQVVIPVTNATVSAVTSSGATCARTATSATCDIASLPGGGSNVIRVTVASAAAGPASATATASFGGVDTNLADNSATASTLVRRVGDVSVEITDSADPVNVGATFDYIITTRNGGPNAGAVQVVIPVTNATVSAVTSSGATCARTATSATCDIASLPGGGSNVIRVTVASAAAGPASATATASFGGVDTNLADNSATASTLVRLVGDISVTATDSVDPATTGVTYDYTVTVSNGGPNAGAVNVSVPVTGTSVASATMPGASCTSTATSVNCDIPSLASGASAVLTINASASAAGAASAVATATFSGTDPVATNNSATANTTVVSPVTPPVSPPVSPPVTPPAQPRRSGGGGGRFDWFLAALLGGLLARRATTRRQLAHCGP